LLRPQLAIAKTAPKIRAFLTDRGAQRGFTVALIWPCPAAMTRRYHGQVPSAGAATAEIPPPRYTERAAA